MVMRPSAGLLSGRMHPYAPWENEMKMTVLRTALLAITLCGIAPAYAEGEAPKKEPSAKQLAQRAKMKACNADAKTPALTGDERKAFMKTCLSGGAAAAPAAPAASAGDEKTKACRAEAKEKALKGDERKAFMKTCVAG